MKAKEMREKDPEELRALVAGWREELFKLGVQSMTGQIEQYSRMREMRRNIARALTVLGRPPAPAAAAGKRGTR
ncbi:MAG: 50S ribosomal protein L29 [bacterium]|nr:50S ribosomal protein L29 [bacterium]